jgi:chlorophyll synthase
MVLNDFKAVKGDAQSGVNSLPVQLGERNAAEIACWTMALPQVVVIILLARWGLHWPSAMVAFSLAMQVVLMQRVLAAPAANAPFYNATGTTLYVLGMLTSAFGLSVIV